MQRKLLNSTNEMYMIACKAGETLTKWLWSAMMWYFIPVEDFSCFPQCWQVKGCCRGRGCLKHRTFSLGVLIVSWIKSRHCDLSAHQSAVLHVFLQPLHGLPAHAFTFRTGHPPFGHNLKLPALLWTSWLVKKIAIKTGIIWTNRIYSFRSLRMLLSWSQDWTLLDTSCSWHLLEAHPVLGSPPSGASMTPGTCFCFLFL